MAARAQVKEPTKGDVYVYVASPLSGFQANGGQTVLGGVNLMAAELNRSGGLLGYKVVIVPMDDESDSDVALVCRPTSAGGHCRRQACAGYDWPL